jgi:putative cardiolipin synthase
MRLLLRTFVLLLLAALGACARLEPRPELPVEAAIATGSDSALDRATAEVEAKHAGQSAFRLVTDGTEAFVARAQSALHAVRSIDVQTYIWHADLTGMFLAQQLLDAADRGVRVRLLLDDLDARAKNAGLAALAAHPNIDARMFNPFASRKGGLSKASEGVRSFGRINRRMHNKSWIADNRVALVGGRNIGDEYFGAGEEFNFVDLDFAMVGPVVREASASFDKYWNSPSAYPMELLDPDSITAPALEKLRAELAKRLADVQDGPYATALRADDAVRRLVAGDWPMQWAQSWRFVSDDPLKVTMKKKDAARTQVGAELLPMVQGTQSGLSVISPYFVPGDKVTEAFVAMVGSGKDVRILTNSLVATDVAAVHGGYARYRKRLVEGGVQIWETKPTSGSVKSSMFGSSGASLHTKAFAVDSRTLFVGSYNLDPRSTWLNCEQGVLVENATLAKELEAIFATQTSGQHAWSVTMNGKDLQWSDGTGTLDSDPDASAGRRFQAWLARVLHLDAQL